MFYEQDKLEIKKDKKGMVFIQGSEVKSARNSKELFALFEEGSKTRHTASTSRFSTLKNNLGWCFILLMVIGFTLM